MFGFFFSFVLFRWLHAIMVPVLLWGSSVFQIGLYYDSENLTFSDTYKLTLNIVISYKAINYSLDAVCMFKHAHGMRTLAIE